MTSRSPYAALGAALLIGAAALGGGCGAGAPAKTDPLVRKGDPVVSLALHGDRGDEQLLACSLVHHYAVFAAGRRIAYDGTVRPPPPKPRWKVKVKIKRCVDGQFQDSGADRVSGGADARFEGLLQPPGKGVFFVRARFRGPQGDVVSRKIYFEVR